MSYKQFQKTLGRIEHSKTTVDKNRQAFFQFYFNYFYNIIVNYFTWENLPNEIDELFLERKLIENGHVAFFEDDELGFILQGGTRGQKLNYYDLPLTYLPVNASSNTRFKDRDIAYNLADFELLDKAKDKRPCIVIPLSLIHI